MKDPACLINNVSVCRLKIEFAEYVMNEKIMYDSMKDSMYRRANDQNVWEKQEKYCIRRRTKYERLYEER